MEKFVLTRQEQSLQNEADIIKNNCLFVEAYSNDKNNIYQSIIKKYYDSYIKYGAPYYQEGIMLLEGNHVFFNYDSSNSINVNLIKRIIEEDLNTNLGPYLEGVYFEVIIITPGYIPKEKNSNLLKKRDYFLLDIGIYQKLNKNIEKTCLQKK